MIKKCAILLITAFATVCAYAQIEDDAKLISSTTTTESSATATTTPAESPVEQTEASPIPAEVVQIGVIGAQFDKFNPKGWVMPFPSTGVTIDQDFEGIRTKLAKHRIGYYLMNMDLYYGATSRAPSIPSNNSTQQYNGQRTTWVNHAWMWVTYNPSDTLQFMFSGTKEHGTFPQDGPSTTRMGVAAVHKDLFHGRLQLEGGYLQPNFQFYGMFTGGSLAGSLTPAAITALEVGTASEPYTVPAANIRYQFPSNFYARYGVQRSIVPGTGFQQERERNNTGFRFLINGTKALHQGEIGYNRAAAPGTKQAFYRVTGFFNQTPYSDYRTPLLTFVKNGYKFNKTDNNFAISVAADKQLWQKNKYLPFQGLYAGAVGQYAPPQQNLFSQCYQATLYGIGLFPNRPMDMIAVSAMRQELSRIGTRKFEALGQGPAYENTTQGALGYTAMIYHGLFANANVSYAQHPGVFINAGAPKKAVIWNLTLSEYF